MLMRKRYDMIQLATSKDETVVVEKIMDYNDWGLLIWKIVFALVKKRHTRRTLQRSINGS
jgi:hypothetical protein